MRRYLSLTLMLLAVSLGGVRAADEQPPLEHQAVIPAPVAEVWKAFTTREGIVSWMVPHAEVDFRVGGTIRTNYRKEGKVGDGGTIEQSILALDPERMFAMKTVRCPDDFPFKTAMTRTWSVIYFEPVEGSKTRVTVRGLGYGSDEESLKMRAFFQQGNAYTLEKLRQRFAAPK